MKEPSSKVTEFVPWGTRSLQSTVLESELSLSPTMCTAPVNTDRNKRWAAQSLLRASFWRNLQQLFLHSFLERHKGEVDPDAVRGWQKAQSH
jgi:hypothetical protein